MSKEETPHFLIVQVAERRNGVRAPVILLRLQAGKWAQSGPTVGPEWAFGI